MQLFLKILSGKSNSVNPDQTAPPQSDLGLHCLHMSFCQTVRCSQFQDIYHSKFFPFRVDPLSEGRQSNFDRAAFLTLFQKGGKATLTELPS